MSHPLRRRGLLVVLSGPAGSGKTTLAARLSERHPDVRRAVTATTRAPREGEVQGRDYFFLDREEFERRLRAGKFVEHAEFNGQLYGTPREELERCLRDGRVVLLVVDVQGAAAIRALMPHALLVFVLPPDIDTLRARLRARGTENPVDLERRLGIAEREVRELDKYDYLVINDDIDAAASELLTLLTMARAHRVLGGELDAWLRGGYCGWHGKT